MLHVFDGGEAVPSSVRRADQVLVFWTSHKIPVPRPDGPWLEDDIRAVQTSQAAGLATVHRGRACRPGPRSKEGLAQGPLDAVGSIVLGGAGRTFPTFHSSDLRKMLQALRAPHTLKTTAVCSAIAVAIPTILLRRPLLVRDVLLAIIYNDAILFPHSLGVFLVALFLVSLDFFHPFSGNFFRVFFLFVRTCPMVQHLLRHNAVQVLHAVQLSARGCLFQGCVVLVIQRPDVRAKFCEENQAVVLTTRRCKVDTG